ncbi:MAG: sulfatase-like hydrolase/transferase [Candidatus Sumerlaeia bacterium]|nr:sulfatase-like hydrolase/transferase [Candidatus Sumerlaeia bacterium]
MSQNAGLSRRKFLQQLGAAACAASIPAALRGQTAPASKSRRPNIVFLFTDQQRYDALSAAGNPALHTPAMDAIARRGVRFTQSFCATPQCSASRGAILTGRWPHSTGVITNIDAIGSKPLDPAIPSAGKVFSAAGYDTAYFGKWHLGGSPSAHGFQTVNEAKGGEDKLVADCAIEYVRRGPQQPFVMFASFINPHDIYGFQKIQKQIELGKRTIALPESRREDLRAKPEPQRIYRDEDQGAAVKGFGDAEWRRYLEVYYHLAERADAEIGRILEALRDNGLDQNTIIVFTSDHGDLGGAHGLPFKGPCMYRELVEVPLAICWPGVIAGEQTCPVPVSNVDLLPTLCDLSGVPIPDGVAGMSLRPMLEGRKPERWREFMVCEYHSKQRWANPIRMLQAGRWKYVRYRRFGEELYDLENDPCEINNLAADLPASGPVRETRDRLAAMLDKWMEQTGDNFAQLEPTTRDGSPLGTLAPAPAPAPKKAGKKRRAT